jgi:hypothetical protein
LPLRQRAVDLLAHVYVGKMDTKRDIDDRVGNSLSSYTGDPSFESQCVERIRKRYGVLAPVEAFQSATQATVCVTEVFTKK